MTERDGAWVQTPPPPMRRALMEEAADIVDREDRRLIIRHVLLIILNLWLWAAALASDPLCFEDAAALVMVVTGAPRVMHRKRRGLLEIRDAIARSRGFAIPGR
jgi:hypothetical protein